MGHRGGDGDVREPSDESRRTAEVDHAVVPGAPRELRGVPTRGAFDQYPLARADHARADPTLVRVEPLLEPGEPRELRLARCVVGEVGGGGAGSGAVYERERAVEFHVVDQLEGRLEIPFGLARKADDEIRGDADSGARRAQLADNRLVLEHRIASLHSR